MERLECSQATLYRLVAELRDFLGAPLEQDPETRGFYYDRSYEQPFELPGIWISPQELQALEIERQQLRGARGEPRVGHQPARQLAHPAHLGQELVGLDRSGRGFHGFTGGVPRTVAV